LATALDFYFDFVSPYGYFASTKIEALAAKYQRTVAWHPVLLGVVFKLTGAQPLTMVPMKGDYSRHDFERTARFHGIAFQFPKDFPLATQAAARVMLHLQAAQGADSAVAFAKAVYHAYFVEGVNIGEPGNIVQIAASLGHDAAAIESAMNSAPVKEQLKAEIDGAIQRGVFGSPFVIADGEPFWGLDRFDQLEAFLKDGRI
jgi:2-hydroxychromene-2-carboxylate isomerase